MQRNEAVDFESRVHKRPAKLGLSERMQEHVGDTPIVEELVAQFDVSGKRRPEQMSDRPAASQGVEEVVPEIVDVNHEEAAGFEDTMSMCQHSSAVLAIADHSQRAEQTDTILGRSGSDKIEVDQIRTHPPDRQIFLVGFLPQDAEHVFREVYTEAGEPTSGEWEEIPSGTATEVHDQPGGRKGLVDHLAVKVEELIVGEVVIVILCNMPSLNILPSTACDSPWQLPLGPARGIRNWRGWSLLSHYWAAIIQGSYLVGTSGKVELAVNLRVSFPGIDPQR